VELMVASGPVERARLMWRVRCILDLTVEENLFEEGAVASLKMLREVVDGVRCTISLIV
jgi:hypothetical protein